MRILVVEDDQITGQHLQKILTQASFSVDLAQTYLQAEKLADDVEYDLCVLDRMLGDTDGLGLCHHWRDLGYNFPILVLTAISSTSEITRSLDDGADDYLSKPFASEVLLARIQALLRRPPLAHTSQIVLANLVLDLSTNTLLVNQNAIDLTQKEFAILRLLVSRPGKIIERDNFSSKIWDGSSEVFSNSLDVHIRNLRKKLADAKAKVLIQSLRGVGFKICDK